MLLTFLMPCASAQEMSVPPAGLIIPDGTPIHLRLGESISSAHARVGDLVDFIVVRDVNLGGFTVVPAGTPARGSITEVRSRRLLGIGGKISLSLDSVELANGDRIGVRARMLVKGRSRIKMMAAGMIATGLIFLPAAPIFLLTPGHESTAVESTEITALVDGATCISSGALQRSPENPSELEEMMDHLPPRVFNAEGREGDMLNLVFVAQEADLQEAFKRAAWVKTDQWKPVFVWHLLRHRTKDTQLPMARFSLFGRLQDYSYALPDPGAVVSRRHHLRIWKTEYTTDGTPIWVGAATHDVAIEIAKRGRLINHRIDPAVDAERDFVGTALMDTWPAMRLEYLNSADPVFQAQTASGETYHSDSRLLLLDLHAVVSTKAGVTGQSSAVVRAPTLPVEGPVESSPE